MKSAAKPVFIVALLLIAVAISVAFLWPKSVRLEAAGTFQDGSAWRVLAVLSPQSALPFGRRDYRMASLELSRAEVVRAVPSLALDDLDGFDPRRPLKVFEEGPVIVVSAQSAQGHSVQWRFLNGQFAQRRILKGGEALVRNVQTAPRAPTLVENIHPDALRRLQPPSLLQPPEESAP